jgi:hypothetical protein
MTGDCNSALSVKGSRPVGQDPRISITTARGERWANWNWGLWLRVPLCPSLEKPQGEKLEAALGLTPRLVVFLLKVALRKD